MSTVIGSRMVNGAGVKYHTMGSGAIRNVAGDVAEYAGSLAVKKLAQMIRGSGYKIAGEGRKRKVGRPKKKNAVAYKKRHAKKK